MSYLKYDLRTTYRINQRWEGDCFCLGSQRSFRGNLTADSAAKDALIDDISNELISSSNLKSCVNKYVLELWQSEWDEFPENKLRKVFPVLLVLGLTEEKRL